MAKNKNLIMDKNNEKLAHYPSVDSYIDSNHCVSEEESDPNKGKTLTSVEKLAVVQIKMILLN